MLYKQKQLVDMAILMRQLLAIAKVVVSGLIIIVDIEGLSIYRC